MGNMSYCRFENTYNKVLDCRDNITDPNLSKSEKSFRKKLIEVCKEIIDEAEVHLESNEIGRMGD